MALVPGLRPFREDRPSANGRVAQRAQAPNPNEGRQPQLRAAASPVQTVGRQEREPLGDDSATALAKSLTAINPSITRFLGVMDDGKREEAEDAARGRIGGMTFDEARQAVQSGEMEEFSNPWFRAAFTRQFGERYALWRAGEMTGGYQNGFDRENGDIEGFIAGRVQEDMQQFGQDRHFTAGYSRIMEAQGNRLRATQAEFRAGRTREQTVGGVFETFLGDARAGLLAGRSPQEIHGALRQRYQGNRDLLRVDFRQQDAEMLRVAETLANEGEYDLVQEILQGNREGVGPLGAVREHATAATRLLDRARTQRDERAGRVSFDDRMRFFDSAHAGTLNRDELLEYHRQNPGVFSDSNVQTLVARNDAEIEQARNRQNAETQRVRVDTEFRQERDRVLTGDFLAAERGQLAFIQTPARVRTRDDIVHGREPSAEVSPTERRTNVVNSYLEYSARTAQERDETPEQTFNRDTAWFSRNGVANPQWQGALSTGYIAASGPNTTGAEVPPGLAAGVEIYRRLHTTNPRLLRAHISDPGAFDFYEAMRIGQEYGGMSDQQAYAAALTVTRDPARTQSVALRQRYEEIANNLPRVGSVWRTDAENVGQMAPELERVARFYAQMGLSGTQSLEEARKRIEATHTNVNGWLVYTADRQIPQGFGDMVGRSITSYVTRFGEAEGVSSGDLTIRPVDNGTGAWVIVNKSTGLPVENMEGRTITLSGLQAADEARLAAEREAATTRTNRRNERRQRVMDTPIIAP